MISRQQNDEQSAHPRVPDGRRVYVYFGSYGLMCYGFDGSLQWKKPLPTPITLHGSSTSPTLVNNRLILGIQGDAGSLMAVDSRTGDTIWKRDDLRFPCSYPVPLIRQAERYTEVIVLGSGGIVAVDLRDGSDRWWVSGLPIDPIPSPFIGGELLFVTAYFAGTGADESIDFPDYARLLKEYDTNQDGVVSRAEMPVEKVIYSRGSPDGTGDVTLGQMFSIADGQGNRNGRVTRDEWGFVEGFHASVLKAENALFAIRPGTHGDVTATNIVWKTKRGLPEVPSPLHYRGNLYTVRNGGIVSCYEAATGKLHYRGRLGARGLYYSSPVAADGKVYATSRPGVVVVFEAGEVLKVLARNDLGEEIVATPAIVDGKLYVRTEHHLYAFGK